MADLPYLPKPGQGLGGLFSGGGTDPGYYTPRTPPPFAQPGVPGGQYVEPVGQPMLGLPVSRPLMRRASLGFGAMEQPFQAPQPFISPGPGQPRPPTRRTGLFGGDSFSAPAQRFGYSPTLLSPVIQNYLNRRRSSSGLV